MIEAGPEATTNAELYQRACRVLPGGVDSPVRAFKAVGGAPYFVERAEGAYVWDVEGHRYVDYVQSYGASILGHAHPEVVEVRTTYGNVRIKVGRRGGKVLNIAPEFEDCRQAAQRAGVAVKEVMAAALSAFRSA